MKYLYLSHFLGPDTPFYGGDGTFQIEPLRSMKQGDNCNTGRWSFPNHAGTHIDLPRHFVVDGACMNDYPPEFWISTQVGLIDISDTQPGFVINPELLESYGVSQNVELLLLKTGFGTVRTAPAYWRESPVFAPDLADYLRSSFPRLRIFGFDTISVSSWMDRPTGRKAHQAFLGGDKPILLLEDMSLSQIDPETKFSRVTVAPLLVSGADAAPCTVIAEVIE
ncbi:MAG: cyclase family protein [Desulfuromonadaceae bacterium]